MLQLAGCAQACQHRVGSHREQPPSDNTSLGSCNPSAALLFLCWHSIWGRCWQEMPGEFLHCLSATFSSHTPQISKWNFRLLQRIFSVLDWTGDKLGFVAEDTVRYYPFTLCPMLGMQQSVSKQSPPLIKEHPAPGTRSNVENADWPNFFTCAYKNSPTLPLLDRCACICSSSHFGTGSCSFALNQLQNKLEEGRYSSKLHRAVSHTFDKHSAGNRLISWCARSYSSCTVSKVPRYSITHEELDWMILPSWDIQWLYHHLVTSFQTHFALISVHWRKITPGCISSTCH